MRQILGTIQTVVATEQVLVGGAHEAFDADGQLTQPLPKQLLPMLVEYLRYRREKKGSGL